MARSQAKVRGAARASRRPESRGPRPQAEHETPPPLLVLDLNGTLLYRQKAGGRAVQGAKITPRPYLQCFLRYCLGTMYDMDEDELRQAWPPRQRTLVDKSAAPYGTQFWLPAPESDSVYQPPRTPVALMIWSSATDTNVDRMVEQFTTTPVQRALFQRVWSRSSLVRTEDIERRVTTAKDLSIVWDDLNAWQAHIHGQQIVQHPGSFRPRALAMHRLNLYRKQLEESRTHGNSAEALGAANSHGSRASDGASNATPHERVRGSDELYAESMLRVADGGVHSVYGPMVYEPWGPDNTILLDDSEGKARCQPENHLSIPEYGAQQAAIFHKAEKGKRDWAEVDDYLLQCVGVLDSLRGVSGVVHWLREGHGHALHTEHTEETRRFWSERGREALARLAIPLEP